MDVQPGSWQELSAQVEAKGERGPGSVNEKAAEIIEGAKAKEDPKKVVNHPGIKTVSLKDGKINLEQFNKEEAAAMPMVGDGNLLLKNNPDAAAFYEESMAEPSPEAHQTPQAPAQGGSTEEAQKAPMPNFANMTYEEKLKRFKIPEDKARKILDSLFSKDGYYEEPYTFGKWTYTIRTCRGEPMNYVFSKLSGYNKMTPDGKAMTDEYMYHKNIYLLAVLMVSCNGKYLVENGKKTEKAIETTRELITTLPDVFVQRMVEDMIDFEAVIKIVTGDGCENFF